MIPALLSIFRVEPKAYKGITLDGGDALLLTLLVYGICGGIVLAALYTLYQKGVPGGLVRALLKAEAHSPETAKTLGELNLGFLRLLRFELRHNLILQKTVTAVGEGENTRYYIDKDLKYRAEGRFEQKGNGAVALILTILLSCLLGILLFLLIPVVLSMIG